MEDNNLSNPLPPGTHQVTLSHVEHLPDGSLKLYLRDKNNTKYDHIVAGKPLIEAIYERMILTGERFRIEVEERRS